MPRAAWIWVLGGLVLPAACTELEPRASSAGVKPAGANAPGGANRPGGSPAPDAAEPPVSGERAPHEDASPMVMSPPTSSPCDTVRAQARQILERNCAPCHQAPANQANFSFCLDVDMLASSASSTGKKFIVPGSPEQSRLFERVANGEMPPAIVMQRPTQSEVSVLRQWIATCVVLGAGGFGNLDGGVRPDAEPEPDPGPGCGKPRQPCCLANTCDNGGCCVLGYCRANGQACAGGPGGDNIPGTCSNGSCSTAGIPCGSLNEACCGVVRSCTAPKTVCPMGMSTCQPCGQQGGSCCKNGGLSTCLEGLNCVNNAYPNPGMCVPCGARGQACCGDGPAARRRCNTGLVCQFEGGTAFVCQPEAGPDAGPG